MPSPARSRSVRSISSRRSPRPSMMPVFDREAAALRVAKDAARAVVAGLHAHRPLQALDRLHVVVEDVGPGVEHRVDVGRAPLEVGDEHLDRGRRVAVADRADRRRPHGRPAVGELVPGDARDDAVAQAHRGDGLGDPGGLAQVELGRTPGLHRAEVAGARADVAEDHHRRGAARPALAQVRALRALADRVELVLVRRGRARPSSPGPTGSLALSQDGLRAVSMRGCGFRIDGLKWIRSPANHKQGTRGSFRLRQPAPCGILTRSHERDTGRHHPRPARRAPAEARRAARGGGRPVPRRVQARRTSRPRRLRPTSTARTTRVPVAVAGRLVTIRDMGKSQFAKILDQQGEIQLYMKKDVVGDDAYAAFGKLDLGDIIGASGNALPDQDRRDRPSGSRPSRSSRRRSGPFPRSGTASPTPSRSTASATWTWSSTGSRAGASSFARGSSPRSAASSRRASSSRSRRRSSRPSPAAPRPSPSRPTTTRSASTSSCGSRSSSTSSGCSSAA